MSTQSLMQQVLGKQWSLLPAALQAHYKYQTNTDIGALDIEYPEIMQPYLNFMRLLGALVNKQGKAIPTTVEKIMDKNIQRWKRTINFPDGKKILFKSHWVLAGNNELIEYVNPFLGLRMALEVKNKQLLYEGKHFILKLGRFLIPIPEWLVLGHTTIVETELDDLHFSMDFRLHHPLLGELFRYSGKFRTT